MDRVAKRTCVIHWWEHEMLIMKERPYDLRENVQFYILADSERGNIFTESLANLLQS